MRQMKGMPTFTVVSDGSNVYYHLPMMNRYSINPAPKSFEELFQAVGSMGATMIFIDNLLGGDVKSALLEGVRKAVYGGKVTVNGQECDLIRFEQDEFDWELWVTRGTNPVVLKVAADMTKGMKEAGDVMPGMSGMKMTIENVFENWSVGQALPADAFAIKPPEGARKEKSLFEDDEEGEPLETLEGKPAPGFTLDLLDGGKATVPVAATNETVVVLDFWATWCGPCRRSLPVVSKVASEYKDKGVVFYAVNQQEQPDQVKAFLEKEGIACPVAMDAEGKVGQAYQMQGIPQTVLIGRDGTVQAIHIGLIPEMEKTLREQLDALVTGKSLIGK
jgi:thiol-disulfide isomerase/thioredoxin